MGGDQYDFVAGLKEKHRNCFVKAKVLEVGSLDINGSIRPIFEECNYTGIDVGEGNGVDLVCEGQDYQGETSSFDTTVSCECFEHNPRWQDTFENMIRMTKSDGLVIMTCATTGRMEHGTTASEPSSSPLTIAKGWEYYRNLTKEDFEQAFNLDYFFKSYEFITKGYDLFFWGVKK
jgi:hypothetical protein